MWDTVSSADSGSDSLAAGVPELVAGVPAHDLASESAQAQNLAWGPGWDRGSSPKAPLRTKCLLSSYSCRTSTPIFPA